MNRYLEIARQIVPDKDSESLDQEELPSQGSPELMRVLRLVLEVFPGSQIVAVDEDCGLNRKDEKQNDNATARDG